MNEKIINYLQKNGFIFNNSSIYNNLSAVFDYGPLGINLKNNIKKVWKKHFISEEPNNYEVESAIFASSKVYEASGHLDHFNDAMIECKACHARQKIDDVVENKKIDHKTIVMQIKNNSLKCLKCEKTNFTWPITFNLMFKVDAKKTNQSKPDNYLYLRPETAQGIFVNFKNVMQTQRLKIPFGIGQFGKSFRNEITTQYFIFKAREFEQAELEFFCKPKDWKKYFDYYLEKCNHFLYDILKLDKKKIKTEVVKKLAHYSNYTVDYLFNFPFGWKELFGIACRNDYDLNAHQAKSQTDLRVVDLDTNKKYLPYVIEPSFGLERLFYALIVNNLVQDTLHDNSIRTVLKIPYYLASYQIAVLPLSKKLKKEAFEVYQMFLRQTNLNIIYDETQSIGKRYRRQDEIGTPFCITIDFDTLNDQKATIRNRDTMEQERLAISELISFFRKLKF